jgi:hypothetical protein
VEIRTSRKRKEIKAGIEPNRRMRGQETPSTELPWTRDLHRDKKRKPQEKQEEKQVRNRAQ